MADDYWPKLVRECTEEMLSIAAQAEANVYDYMVPSLLETQAPAARQSFYDHGSPDSPLFSQGLDWDVLKGLAPELWAKYSDDALNLQQNDLKKQADALDKLHEQEFTTGLNFRRQIQSPKVFGLNTGQRVNNAAEAGLNSSAGGQGETAGIPMGRFG